MPASSGVAPDLLAAWAAARSLSRGLPPPFFDGDAVRVDTGLPSELRRYIFPKTTPAITALATSITEPHVLIKLCAPLDVLMAMLPSGWKPHPQSYFMTCDGPMRAAAAPLPPGFTLTVDRGDVLTARITTADGTLAARGRAARHAGLFVYDQIVTCPAYRRRGLGGHVMRALAATDGGRGYHALTATADGHALYTALGWTMVSLYSTAEFNAQG